MSRHNSAPTHAWVIGSQINKWLALLFIIITLLWAIWIWTVTYTLRQDCNKTYDREFELFGYWLTIQAGQTKDGCPQP